MVEDGGKNNSPRNVIDTQPIRNQCSKHIETSQLICRTNWMAGFFMIGILVINGLKFGAHLVERIVSHCTKNKVFH